MISNLRKDERIDEALAKAMRLNIHGEMRPLWEDVSPRMRDGWLQQARFVRRVIEHEGFFILNWKPEKKP